MDSTWLEHHEEPRTAEPSRALVPARHGSVRPVADVDTVPDWGGRTCEVSRWSHTGAWGTFAYAAPDHGWIVTGTVNRFGVDRRPVLRAVVDALLAGSRWAVLHWPAWRDSRC